MPDDRDVRRQRLQGLLGQRRYAEAVSEAASDLSALLGTALSEDDAVTMKEAADLLDVVGAQGQYHLMNHRCWGVRLRPEMLAVTRRLADVFEGHNAVLLLMRSPTPGLQVSASAALRRLPEQLGPPLRVEADRVSDLDLVGSHDGTKVFPDFALVRDRGDSGLLLEYNHYAWGTEFELRTWGSFAIVLDVPPGDLAE